MTTTNCSNVIDTIAGNKCSYERHFVCKQKFNLSLKTFGEIGIVATNEKIQGKLRYHGSTCMFDG
jgi:hypothetical protein